MSTLIDRRLNGRNKSAVNRARFMARYKTQIRRAVRELVDQRSMRDIDQGGDVKLPTRDIHEPTFHHGPGGDRETVHPGNREFNRGDTIERPRQGGGGSGPGEPGQGEGMDEFTFTLSRKEFLDLFFEDLALPHLVRNRLGDLSQPTWQRAGYTVSGPPSQLSIRRTLQTSLARRIALGAEPRQRLAELEAAIAAKRAELGPSADADADVDASVHADADAHAVDGDGAGASAGVGANVNAKANAPINAHSNAREELMALEAEAEACRAQLARLPFLDDVDLRYRNRVAHPTPVARAVMVCLMDVSGSMDEHKKDLAKRFYTLLYLFLTRNYEHVELVFIRHTDNAEEVDEHTFFHDRKSGGTVVLSALQLMHEVLRERYPADSWNIYGAQASDGDAFGADAGRSARFLKEHLLPLTRYYAYVEVLNPGDRRRSSLWAEYELLTNPHFSLRQVRERQEIYPVFRELFQKELA